MRRESKSFRDRRMSMPRRRNRKRQRTLTRLPRKRSKRDWSRKRKPEHRGSSSRNKRQGLSKTLRPRQIKESNRRRSRRRMLRKNRLDESP